MLEGCRGQGQRSSPQAHQVWAGHLSPRLSFFLATGPAVRTGRGWEGARSPSVLGSSKSEPMQSKDLDIPEQKSLLLKHRAEEKVLEEPPGWNSPLFLAGFLVRTQNIHSQCWVAWEGWDGCCSIWSCSRHPVSPDTWLVSPDSPIPPWSSHVLHCLHRAMPIDPQSPGHLCPLVGTSSVAHASRIPPFMSIPSQDALHPCQEGERQSSWPLTLQHTPTAPAAQ